MTEGKLIKTTVTLITVLIIALSLLFVTNPPLRSALLSYIVFLAISYGAYRFADFKNLLIPLVITGPRAVTALFTGVILGVGYIAVTVLFPGASIGVPLLPGTVSETVRNVIIIVIAPIVEEIFFRGVILAFLLSRKAGKNNPLLFAVGGQAVLFALAHLGESITGIYNYPTLPSILTPLGANIGSFLSAGAFGFLAGFFILRSKANKSANLLLTIIFHMIINFWVIRPFIIV